MSRCRGPRRRDQLGDREPDWRILALRAAVLLADELMIHRGNGILPDQRFLRNERAEVARERTHVAVRQLEPSLGERIRELLADDRESAWR